MGWRCVTILSLVVPTIAQVAGIPLSRLQPDATLTLELERGALVTADALWIPQRARGAVVRVLPTNNSADAPIPVAGSPCASLIAEGTGLWMGTCGDDGLIRVDIEHRNASPAMPLRVAQPHGRMALAGESLWVITDTRGVLTRVDHDARMPVAEVYVAGDPYALAASNDTVWVTSATGVVTPLDARTNVVGKPVTVGARPGPLAIGDGAVWVLNRGDGSVSRIDEATRKVTETITVGDGIADADLAVGEGAVWLSAPGVPLVRIDARTNRVTHRFAGTGGGAVVVGHGSVWISAAPGVTWRLDPDLVAATRVP